MTFSRQHIVGDMFCADQGDLWWHSHVEYHHACSLRSQESCPLCMSMNWAGGGERQALVTNMPCSWSYPGIAIIRYKMLHGGKTEVTSLLDLILRETSLKPDSQSKKSILMMPFGPGSASQKELPLASSTGNMLKIY